MSRVHPWFCCTQQKVEVMSIRHCAGEQHAAPMPGEQVDPGAAHDEHTPPLQVSPEQHSESLEQVCARARHWQLPPLQVIDPQQSELDVHDWLAPAQEHRPPLHARPLQQSLEVEHAPPAGLQQVPEVLADDEVQEIDPQQRGPPVMHDAPAIRHGSDIIWQRPLWQTSPEAQSLLLLHEPPELARPQRPLWQVSEPQHCVSLVHAPDSARQQRSEPWAFEHIVPEAQPGEPPGVQGAPGGRGVVPLVQVEPVQVVPVQQSLDVEQAEPAELQRRQVPPTHESVGLVQVVESQQRWPSPPHTGVGEVTQRFVDMLQVKPELHAPPVPQQASPSPPQGVVPIPGPQVPMLHARPELQALVPQQG